MDDPLQPASRSVVEADVERALAEDIGDGDATASLLPADARATAEVICREAAVIAGRPWFDACFHRLDRSIAIRWDVEEGARVAAGQRLCRLSGPSRPLVTAERTALNFLQTLSATATAAAACADAVSGTATCVLDTRKTLPGLRLAQKYAVRIGGASNHRLGLYDAVMVKENHIAAAGGIAAAVARSRQHFPGLPVIVEVESLDELDQALAAGADRILLDDFDPPAMHEAVRRSGGRVPLEVSGGVDLESLPAVAAAGVDFVSVGAITKHVRAVDLSMRIVATT